MKAIASHNVSEFYHRYVSIVVGCSHLASTSSGVRGHLACRTAVMGFGVCWQWTTAHRRAKTGSRREFILRTAENPHVEILY